MENDYMECTYRHGYLINPTTTEIRPVRDAGLVGRCFECGRIIDRTPEKYMICSECRQTERKATRRNWNRHPDQKVLTI